MEIGDRAPHLADAFDTDLDAVVLRSYDAVCAALDDPNLAAIGETNADVSRHAHRAVRGAARDAFSRAQVSAWQIELTASAMACASRIAASPDADLIADFARPSSLALALRALGSDDNTIDQFVLAEAASVVFRDAAHSTTGAASMDAQAAAAELARALNHRAPTAAVDVQSFVALSQTLPCLLGAMWLALLEQPAALAELREMSPSDLARAIDELLRFTSTSCAVFRRALGATRIGGLDIAPGRLVIVRLADANRDPSRFPHGDRLDLARDATGHVALGRGRHSCVGASVVRMAAVTATRALLHVLPASASIRDVAWIDGFAIRGPSLLRVSL